MYVFSVVHCNPGFLHLIFGICQNAGSEGVREPRKKGLPRKKRHVVNSRARTTSEPTSVRFLNSLEDRPEAWADKWEAAGSASAASGNQRTT